MKSPVLGGKITSTKMPQKNESSLNSSKSGSQAVKKIAHQNSYAVMEVETGASKKSGGGRDIGASVLGELNRDGGLKASARHDTNEMANGNAGNQHGGGAVVLGGDGAGVHVDGGEGAGEDVQAGGQTYEEYFRNADDGMEFGKSRGVKNKLKNCLRKMGCGTSQITSLEDTMPVVVFGATGTVGGAVVRALLRDHRFTVKAVTRTPTTDQARSLAEEGAVVVPADLNDTRSLLRVMEGAAGVFLHTNYWEHLSKQKEITHGMNVIDAAIACNVHHLIYSGSDPSINSEKPCGYMDAKAAVEEYIKETALPYTVVKLPFLYENLLSLFKPHMIRPGIYTLPIPLEEKAMDIMAMHDAARCVVNVFLRPKNHMQKSVSIMGERMTVQHMAEVLNKQYDDKKIMYHRMSPSDYSTFDFPGSHDLAAMFTYLQTVAPRDPRITRRIFHTVTILDKWVAEHKEQLNNAMKGGGDDSGQEGGDKAK